MPLLAPPDVFRVALRAAVKGGYFTPKQASQFARKLNIDLGWLPGREPLDVSISPDVWPLVYLELLALLKGTPYGLPRANWEDARDYIAFLKLQDLLAYHERLQTRFEEQNRRLAGLLFAGGITLAAWRTATWANIRKLIFHQAALGSGKVPDVNRIRPVLERESEYFRKFSEAIFAGHVANVAEAETLNPVPQTPEAVQRRADLYGGTARGLFYEFHEERESLAMGWVVHYQIADDTACKPCRDAEGYYLPAKGPMPGRVCQGRGKCRCVRRPVFDRTIYDRLMQEAG